MLRAPLTPTGRLAARHFFSSIATVQKADVPPPGGRFVIEEDRDGNALKDPILVVSVDNAWYAIDATCPHMKKSMEKGSIVTDGDTPQIQCPIHNSRFSLKTGVCTQWVTGVLGYDNKLASGLARKVGGEKQNVKAYSVVENDDGSLTIDTP
jgi:nitrite reductase/ring-hydroxylating ferredoxin subunit